MYIKRRIQILEALQQKSIFLLGPRQTGKSFLIKNVFPNVRTYNLLESDTLLKLSRSPERIRQECTANDQFIIIDEIQKLPVLLNEVHLLIEERNIHFLLTGSSARKLRRGGVNLLGGRAHVRYLHPFSFIEVEQQFELEKVINFGLLPSIFLSETPEDNLRSYVGLYLQEEIAAEGLARNVPAFSRFLEIAALCNGKMINFTKIANDAQVARTTVMEYFRILQDTLIAYELLAWNKSIKRKPIHTSKMYFFDLGVVRVLQGRKQIQPNTPEFGDFFECFIFHELKAFVDYNQISQLHYWRSVSGYEVDFILNDSVAIEVKTSKNIGHQDLKNLKALCEEQQLQKYILVCLENTPRIIDGINIYPWRYFLEQLWSGAIIG